MEVKRSRNSYILSPRSVTFAPIGMFSRNLKLETAFLEIVAIAFCPVIRLNSSTPVSTSFLSATAAPIPLLITIFVKRGTCMLDLYWNFPFNCETISLTYFSFNLGVAMFESDYVDCRPTRLVIKINCFRQIRITISFRIFSKSVAVFLCHSLYGLFLKLHLF
ncbi:hypothetical protein D3C87_1663310 [compost metagenome]